MGEQRGQLRRWGGARPPRPIAPQLCPRAEPAAHPPQRGAPDDPPPGRGRRAWARFFPHPSPRERSTGEWRRWERWGAPPPAGCRCRRAAPAANAAQSPVRAAAGSRPSPARAWPAGKSARSSRAGGRGQRPARGAPPPAAVRWPATRWTPACGWRGPGWRPPGARPWLGHHAVPTRVRRHTG